MQVKFIEAVENLQFNWGKFMIGRFDNEWEYRSALDDGRLLPGRGWSRQHLLVLDLQAGEGAVFKHEGNASSDLNGNHQIWVSPLFEPVPQLAVSAGCVSLGQVAGTGKPRRYVRAQAVEDIWSRAPLFLRDDR